MVTVRGAPCHQLVCDFKQGCVEMEGTRLFGLLLLITGMHLMIRVSGLARCLE